VTNEDQNVIINPVKLCFQIQQTSCRCRAKRKPLACHQSEKLHGQVHCSQFSNMHSAQNSCRWDYHCQLFFANVSKNWSQCY